MSRRLHVYHYAGCSTCKSALSLLRDLGKTFESTDLVTQPPDTDTLRALWAASGLPLQSFFNVSGQSYRAGGFKDRVGSMSDAEKLAALAADGKLVKRPLLAVYDAKGKLERVLVGLREEAWREALG